MVPSEFLPSAMATIGAHLPTGTLVGLITSINYFPEAATVGQWLTLAIWAIAGMLLILIGALIHARKPALKVASQGLARNGRGSWPGARSAPVGMEARSRQVIAMANIRHCYFIAKCVRSD